MWTLTATPGTFLTAAIVIFLGGKLLQQGGRAYSEGRNWVPETLMGALCNLGVIFSMGVLLVVQNVQ